MNFLDAYSNISVPTIQSNATNVAFVEVIFSSTGQSISVDVTPTSTIKEVVTKAQQLLGMNATNNLNVTTDLLPTQSELSAVGHQSIVQMDGAGNQRTVTQIRVTAGKLNSNG